MEEYELYDYYDDTDKIKVYGESIHDYFESKYSIIIESIDFDENQNVILFIDHYKIQLDFKELEKELLKNIKHLNDVEVKNMKIVLTFDSKEIELC